VSLALLLGGEIICSCMRVSSVMLILLQLRCVSHSNAKCVSTTSTVIVCTVALTCASAHTCCNTVLLCRGMYLHDSGLLSDFNVHLHYIGVCVCVSVSTACIVYCIHAFIMCN
jgi:hypothetical protein